MTNKPTDINKNKFDVNDAVKQAEAEVLEERNKAAVAKIKAKMKEREAARTVLRNIDREIEALKDELSAGL